MKTSILLSVFMILFAVQDSPLAISSPASGEVLRGEVTITGSTAVTDFSSAQLDFRYASDPGETWFPLATFTQPALDSPLYLWNTASITDGEYFLRLRVILTDGSTQEVTVPITIQNDTPILAPSPTSTSTPEFNVGVQIPTAFLLAASPTPTEVPRPTPTLLPANPAALTHTDLYSSLARGALVILGLFIMAGIILRVRNA